MDFTLTSSLKRDHGENFTGDQISIGPFNEFSGLSNERLFLNLIHELIEYCAELLNFILSKNLGFTILLIPCLTTIGIYTNSFF
jgi:hypothetical protein